MPGPLLSNKDIATGAISFQGRKFDRTTGKARQARVFFSFTTANAPVSMPHSLNRVPTSFQVAACGAVDVLGTSVVPPGIVYSTSALPGQALNATKNYAVLASTVSNSWAEVILS